jgi:tRNA(fMet)-specific endonuclease VapC
VELIDRAEWIGMPVVVLGELAVGFRHGSKRAANHAELDRFLAHPVVEVLPVTADVVPIYADIIAGLRKAGTPLPANDVWIAAVTARYGGTLLTYDAHFNAIPRVGATVLAPPSEQPDTA